MTSTWIEQAAQNRLIRALSTDQIECLGQKFELIQLMPRQELIGAHQDISDVYFPLSGIVLMLVKTSHQNVQVGMIGREGIVGLPVVFGVTESPWAFVVQREGLALRIATNDLRRAFLDQPSLLGPFGVYAQELFVQLAQTSYVNAAFNLKTRLARIILMAHDRIDEDEVLYTHDDLAGLLSFRRSSITVAMQGLEGMGLIKNKRGRIVVLNRPMLETVAGDAYQVAEEEYERLLSAMV